jgi:hypothetical protein
MTRSSQAADRFSWYSSLKHGGLLIAPSRLAQFYPEDPPPLAPHLADRLRRDLNRLETGSRNGPVSALLDTVLELICDLRPHDGGLWFKGSNVPPEWSRRAITGEIVKPRRIWTGPDNARLPVFVDDDAPNLGKGRGRRTVARVIEWLRASDLRIALLTNARQWRLIYAGLDHDAFAEWDTDLWFEEGTPGPQVAAVQALLSRESITNRLIPAVQATRQGQSELSSILGERVRQAVELLIRAHTPDPAASPRDIYLAATRIVMRMVVLLFAEAREDLLPLDNPIYHDSYGLQALRESLARAAGGARLERLRHRYCAWPRILALFRLIYEGSGHEALPVVRYGGELFRPGDPESNDPLRRALSAFESLPNAPNDATVYQLLDLLCTSPAKVRQGRSATWVSVPVDFSDLSSAYIGILYEGLLDFELRRADDIVIFLNVGDEPALPLSRLEGMSDPDLKSLVEKFKQRSGPAIGGDEEADGEAETEEDEEGEEVEEDVEAEAPEEVEAPPLAAEAGLGYDAATALADSTDVDKAHAARERARTWARRAAIAGKLVPRRATEADLIRTADALIARTILPGEWYLVRWGGTRKGSGTFYTRPELAVPTVQRTLRPLVYDPPKATDGKLDEDAPASAWTPKKPEEILALKVCDPSCGSGSFLVASLRFLTDALLASLHHHGRINEQGERTLVTLAEGRPGGQSLAEELLPCRPDDPDFEPRLRAPQALRGRTIDLRRRSRSASRRTRALDPLDRDDGQGASLLVPRSQGPLREQPRRLLVRPLP